MTEERKGGLTSCNINVSRVLKKFLFSDSITPTKVLSFLMEFRLQYFKIKLGGKNALAERRMDLSKQGEARQKKITFISV